MKIKENPIKRENLLSIYTDGASRGNPGRASCSFIFLKNSDTNPFLVHSEYLGENITNNIAEYEALIKALNCAVKYTRWNIKMFSDSKLVVNQLNGVWRVKKEHLQKEIDEIFRIIKYFKKIKFFFVPRTNNFIKKIR